MNGHDAHNMMEKAVIISRSDYARNTSAAVIADTVAKLARLGIEATRNAERLCSDESYSQERFDKKVSSIAGRVFLALADCGFPCTAVKIEVHGDPRGSCLRVYMVDYRDMRF